MYLKEIGNYNLLTAAEEVMLAKKAEKGSIDAAAVYIGGYQIALQPDEKEKNFYKKN